MIETLPSGRVLIHCKKPLTAEEIKKIVPAGTKKVTVLAPKVPDAKTRIHESDQPQDI